MTFEEKLATSREIGKKAQEDFSVKYLGVKTEKDIDMAVEKIVFDGLIGKEEKKHLKNEITEVLAVPEINRLFNAEYTILTEREIILPGGEMLRPDRVIIKNNKAIVIDFKTGKKNKKHEDQLIKYVDILRKMNYQKVEGKIIYLTERSIIEIEI